MHKLIITKVSVHDTEIQACFYLKNNLMHEIRILRDMSAEGDDILGNIYVGRVQRIVKNIGAAFIEIAPGLACYYPIEKERHPIYVTKMPSEQMVQNDEILVQVQKESVKTKAPTVSTNLNLTGRYIVVTSENKKIGISSKLREPMRSELKNLITGTYSGPHGIVVRTNAQNAQKEDILEELNFLTARMDDIILHAGTRTCYSCVSRSLPKYLTALQSASADNLEEIVTDDPVIYNAFQEYCGRYSDLRRIPLRLYNDVNFSLAAAYNLNKQVSRALDKKVWLKSGGFLIIEPTEALTVIDVNTGKALSGNNPQKQYLQTNLEATEEIAHQLRLRNISGIIIIDYIDMKDKENQKRLLEHLRSAVKGDPVPVQVHDITRLNLVELTRKKIEKSLAEHLKSLQGTL